MPQPYSLDLRERVVRLCRGRSFAPRRCGEFQVSVSFVVNLVKAVRSRGSFEAGNHHGNGTPDFHL